MPEITRYHVASGSYRIDTQKPMILEAYLGTCVGVAVYDSVAGIGGLIHLLLPEPISNAAVSHPEKYASTGFPAFLQALYEAGASAENMKATVAGGALEPHRDVVAVDVDVEMAVDGAGGIAGNQGLAALVRDRPVIVGVIDIEP